MKPIQTVICVSAIFWLFAQVSPPAWAEGKPLVIRNGEAQAERTNAFSGVVALDLLKPERDSKPVGSVIMTQKDLEALFEAWMLGDPPKIDFSKQVLTVSTWGGSQLRMLRFIDEEGNLSVTSSGGSKDLVNAPGGGRGMTYLIEVYTLTNIKTVNGQEWTSPAQEAERDGADQPATAPE